MLVYPLAPIFLFGILTAGIPVLIHLLARRESVRVEWPTLRFLEETERRTARRRRIEQLLLMLLRAATMLLLAVGLARPVLRYAAGAAGDACVVLVLDDTLSSRAEEEGEKVFDRARAAGLRILEGLGENSLCGLVLVSGAGAEGTGGLFPGPGRVRELLRAARPTYRRGNIALALARALELAASEDAPLQEVYYLGDLQASAFPLPGEVSARARHAILVLVPSGAASPQNLTLSRLSLRLPVPASGTRLTVQADIESHASIPMKTTATLLLDGTRRGAQEVDLPPSARTRISFSVPVEGTGLHRVAVEIGRDCLNADNRRCAAFFIPRRIRVLVLGGPMLDAEAFHFLSCALDPFAGSGEGGRLLQVEKARVPPAGLERYAAVFVLGRALPAASAPALEEYLQAGGTVVLIPGTDGLFPPLAEAAGIEAGKVVKVPGLSLAFSRKSLSLPPFAALSGLGPGAFAAVEPRRLVPVSVREPAAGRPAPVVVLATTDGRPVLLLQEREGGRLFVLTTGTDTTWGNLVLRGIFPLMVEGMVYQSALAGGARGLSARVGETPTLPVRARAVDLTSPSGRMLRLAVRGDRLRIEGLEEPGLYRLTDAADGRLLAFVSVNPDPLEGDLRPISPEEACRRLEPCAARCLAATSAERVGEVLAAVRKGVPIFDYILGLVAAVVVFEAFFANRVGPAGRKDA